MPSLRKRVSTYLRQLSFHNEPRERRNNVNENAFVTKYLQGHIRLRDTTAIIHGKNPTDLPIYKVEKYECGPKSVVGCYSGPNGGLTTVKRSEKHLSVPDDDIDFIDNPHEDEEEDTKKPNRSPKRIEGQPIDNTTMVIKVAGHQYCVTNKPKRHSKSLSLGSIGDFQIEVETTKIDKEFYSCDSQPPEGRNSLVMMIDHNEDNDNGKVHQKNGAKTLPSNYQLAKSRSEGNPFRHKKRGKIVQAERASYSRDAKGPEHDDSSLPEEWTRKSDYFYGISDSLYDRNQVTKHKNGDPIADCFGLIARKDSAILAVADGVNWGEKASIAAKSALHASLHYLNKTIFNDTEPFDQLTKTEITGDSLHPNEPPHLVTNTQEVFVCLLRAFNCAHDLILENNGMLTTLTVAVVLPLKRSRPRYENGVPRSEAQYVCCVCNVGDTLAYVYSPKTGIRELTKGSHDVTSNRDMRDALGALGPVDGINPELSNLTLAVTTLNRGDIIILASDGLTDNFDPNVCRFTVNSKVEPAKTKPKPTTRQPQQPVEKLPKPPVKPPRRSKIRSSASPSSGSQSERSSQEKDDGHHHSMEPKVIENKASSLRKQAAHASTTNYQFLKSRTSLDLRPAAKPQIVRNEEGIPYVTPIQRYELQLLLMEDILRNGISGRDAPITTAKKLCEHLLSFTVSITAAKRRTLEDQDMYYDNRNGVLVEVSSQEKKLRRKKGLEKVQTLPGKLDHVTVVAYNVGLTAL